MYWKKVVFVFLLILLFVKIWLDWNFYSTSSSVIPGWHITIYEPSFVESVYFKGKFIVDAAITIFLFYYFIENSIVKSPHQ